MTGSRDPEVLRRGDRSKRSRLMSKRLGQWSAVTYFGERSGVKVDHRKILVALDGELPDLAKLIGLAKKLGVNFDISKIDADELCLLDRAGHGGIGRRQVCRRPRRERRQGGGTRAQRLTAVQVVLKDRPCTISEIFSFYYSR